MLKMPQMFLSTIFVESQDSGSHVAKAAQEEIVPTMVEQRNNFSNKFEDFQALIDDLMNHRLMARQRFEQLEEQRVKQAKVRVNQVKVGVGHTKAKVEEQKQ